MAEDFLQRLERAVRRFGGPLPIDDLLPELDADSDVFLTPDSVKEPPPAAAPPQPPDAVAGWRELTGSSEPEGADGGCPDRDIEPAPRRPER